MRAIIGAILMLVGGAVALTGIVLAVMPLINMYQENLDDPLNMAGDQSREHPEGREQAVPHEMMRGVWIGLGGAIPFVIGSTIIKGEVLRRARGAIGKLQAGNAPDAPEV